ncbi:MAG: nitronate monooxygenase [Dehalococcoidia bacterium]|nr:nitronate monooxygenase [Dehalococcoidia bacterium]
MAQKINTRVNRILGTEYPLIVGTMMGWSNAELVAAAANAGAFACMPSAMYSTPQALRDEIKKARSLTDKPFGVNINLFPALRPQNLEEYVDAVLEEGIGVIETAGRSPEELVDRIKKGGAKLMHKCARLRDAKKAEGLGVDLIEIVGFECGGHPSREGIGGLVLIPQVVDAVKVPVIAGGGIGDARGFVAVMALGAEGVLMGTRFLASRECQLHPNLKNKLVDAQSTESTLALASMGDPMRVLQTSLIMQVQDMERKGATLEELLPVVSGEKSMKAMSIGDVDNSLLPCGQVVGMIHEISSMEDIIKGIMQEAEAVYEKLGKVIGGKG